MEDDLIERISGIILRGVFAYQPTATIAEQVLSVISEAHVILPRDQFSGLQRDLDEVMAAVLALSESPHRGPSTDA